MATASYLEKFNDSLEPLAYEFLERNRAVLEPIHERIAVQYGLSETNRGLHLKVVEDKYGANYSARFALYIGNKAVHLAAFTLDMYPACCALHTVNDFYCKEVDEKLLDDLFATCRNAYMNTVGGNVRRVMFNFLETSRQNLFKPSSKDIPEDEKSTFTFPEWRKWALSKKDAIQTRFVNHNTDRIIHNTIVIL